jgi:hypothetical protein
VWRDRRLPWISIPVLGLAGFLAGRLLLDSRLVGPGAAEEGDRLLRNARERRCGECLESLDRLEGESARRVAEVLMPAAVDDLGVDPEGRVDGDQRCRQLGDKRG